jgi:hypothetical protein
MYFVLIVYRALVSKYCRHCLKDCVIGVVIRAFIASVVRNGRLLAGADVCWRFIEAASGVFIASHFR